MGSLTLIVEKGDNLLMIKALTLVLFLISTPLFAQSVSDITADDSYEFLTVTLYTNNKANSFDIFEEAGSAASSSNPHKIYVPFMTTGTANQNFSYYASRASLPTINGGTPTNSPQLRFVLDVDVNGNADDLHVAVADSVTGTYYVLDFIATTTDGTFTYDLSFSDICNITDLTFRCDDFNQTVTPNEIEELGLFFFVNDGILVEGDTITASNYTGDYYELNMSNRIYTSNFVSLTELRKGDEQLRANYSTFSFGTGYAYSLFAYVQPGAADTLCDSVVNTSNSSVTLGSEGISFGNLTDLLTVETSGLAPVKSLENNRCYNVQLFFCDRFGFCSYSSEEIQNSPEDIEALLEQQACFFFTAGFGEQHYVVDYFQAFRDNILLKSRLGRAFVNWYYDFAPQHTPYILERPWLQKIIRGIAYVLYGLMHSLWAILFFISLAVVQSLRLRRSS